ncbi:UBX domain-containing protein 4 [Anastrepha obliqua]|uniref:UBX domain-containing protein 4 n=1 Tax=Anastrepha obliqua TaxID=95512 RepID=UPI002409DD27|nr:UBX domain-containing protein 4 [Anastrepha obliqua]
MNWYKGNIAEAVAESKAKNAIFVVYVEGKNESTTKLSNFLNDEKVRRMLESDDFVAIKIESDSQSYMQFATIYQVVPVPSIFFIGKSGTPLEIGTGIIASVEELEEKINKVLIASGRSTPSVSSSTSLIEAEQKAQSATTVNNVKRTTREADEALPVSLSSTDHSINKSDTEVVDEVKQAERDEIVCDGDVCYKKPKAGKEITVANKETEMSTNQAEQNEATANARLEETRQKMEELRRKRIEEEKQLEKERELKRRQEGKVMQNLQQWQREQELKELKENIRREKLEEMAARERIRAQIAADRAERAQKFSISGDATASTANVDTPNAESGASSGGGPIIAPDSTRIQFRFPSGNTATHVFNCQDTLNKLREYVRIELLPGTGIKNFTLATTYPKQELNVENDDQTLAELSLFPSAVILIIGKESTSSPAAIIARSGGLLNIFTTLVMSILSPVFSIFGYFKNIATGGRRGNDTDAGSNIGATKRANDGNGAAHEDAAKRRNMERFGGGTIAGAALGNSASTSADAATEQGETKPYRRYGGSNIHRLTDHKDSDDENATWNGNSTQQQ